MSVVFEMPEAEYHAHPALSSTGAKLILKSPAKYRYVMDNPQPPKDAFDLGSAVHTKVLGTGWDVEVLDFDNYLTKAAKEARDDARAAGKIPLLRKVADEVTAMSESVLANQIARELFEQGGSSEVSVFAIVDGVETRCRFDFLPELGHAFDLKTAADASKREFEKAAVNYGYDLSRAFYLETLEAATGRKAEMLFVVVEKEPPYLTAVHQLDVVFDQMGRGKAAEARRLFGECNESGIWPGYPDGIQLLSPPTYAVYEFEEKYGD